MISPDSTVTISIAFLLNLLIMAFAIGRNQEKTKNDIEGIKKDVNGVGTKTGKIILYLTESAPEAKRERLTDILK
jgi:hypothetical protein